MSIKAITLNRAEGLIDECNKPAILSTPEDAAAILQRWALTAPWNGSGYHKVDLTIDFDEGDSKSYRFDLIREHSLFGRVDLLWIRDL